MSLGTGPTGAAPLSAIHRDRDDQDEGPETIDDSSPEETFRGVEDQTHQRSRRDPPEDEEILDLEEEDEEQEEEEQEDSEPGGYNREAAIDRVLRQEWDRTQQQGSQQQHQGPFNFLGQAPAWHDQQMAQAGLNPQDQNDRERWGYFIRTQQAEENARWANYRVDRLEQRLARNETTGTLRGQFASLGRERAGEAAEMVADLEAAGLPRNQAVARVKKLTGATASAPPAKKVRQAPPSDNAANLRNAASVTGRGGARRLERAAGTGADGKVDPTRGMADIEKQMNNFRKSGRVPNGFGQRRQRR